MLNEFVVLFTAKSIERILREGGTSSWRLDRNHARKCRYAVCTRNSYAEWVEGKEPHHSVFVVGKVKDVVPSPSEEGDWLILFSEYAQVSIPEFWRGDRNPVRYLDEKEVEKLGLDVSTLKWQPMPKRNELEQEENQVVQAAVRPLTIAEAKRGLALAFRVPPEAIEITIRG